MEEKVFGPRDSETSDRLLKKTYWTGDDSIITRKKMYFEIQIIQIHNPYKKKDQFILIMLKIKDNELLKEIQLKDLHIQSLEKLIQ